MNIYNLRFYDFAYKDSTFCLNCKQKDQLFLQNVSNFCFLPTICIILPPYNHIKERKKFPTISHNFFQKPIISHQKALPLHTQTKNCTRSLKDRITDSGSVGHGSIPCGCTKLIPTGITKADRNNCIQIIQQNALFIAIVRRIQKFFDCCVQLQFSRIIYLYQMIAEKSSAAIGICISSSLCSG